MLDAIILADDPLSHVRIAGLAACERAVRVAKRVGAARVVVVDRIETRSTLVDWREGRTCPVLVIRANQLVHTPLVAPLIETISKLSRAEASSMAMAVEDLTTRTYAGAFVATGEAADAAIAALARGELDDTVVIGATPIPHGEIARAPIATPTERRAAHQLLYKILVKPQDNAVTRYLYRPVSFPLTRLLVWTPITPNQISYVVAAMVAIGCWLTAHASMHMALLGTVVVLAASYVDCCDGEVARVKLLSSRFGAWIDTVVDELSSVGYMAAIGWHCHLHFGPQWFGNPPFDPWLVGIAISVPVYLWGIYCIYYNIIVAVGSANSQDYVGRFEVAPGREPEKVRLVPAPPKIATKRELPPWLEWLATNAPYIVRRDFIAWGTVVLAALHLTSAMFVGFVIFGFLTSVVLTIDHVKLRSLRRSIVRRGQMIEAP